MLIIFLFYNYVIYIEAEMYKMYFKSSITNLFRLFGLFTTSFKVTFLVGNPKVVLKVYRLNQRSLRILWIYATHTIKHRLSEITGC